MCLGQPVAVFFDDGPGVLLEVKSSASVNESDGHGLRRLAEQCGRDFQGGILVYTGGSVLPMEDKRIWAVPIRDFWSL